MLILTELVTNIAFDLYTSHLHHVQSPNIPFSDSNVPYKQFSVLPLPILFVENTHSLLPTLPLSHLSNFHGHISTFELNV